MEQYNLARVRRGLPVDHPVPEVSNAHQGAPEGSINTDDLDRIFDRPLDSQEQREVQNLAEELEQQGIREQQVIDNFDQSLLEDHTERSDSNDTSMASNVSSTSGGGMKRPSNPSTSAQADNPAKKQALADKSTLPGTGRANEPGLEGGPREYALVSPSHGIYSYVRYYRKVHRFLTWGIAYRIIAGGSNRLWMTTPLAQLPWDWLFLYMNRAEYNTLPRGSAVDHVKVKVLQRNVRVAFPTNSTNSNLATLNQNKNIITAIGLNKNIAGQNARYTSFQNDQPMIPTTTTTPTYANYTAMNNDMYFNENATNFRTQVPRHQMGIPQILPHYYMLLHQQQVVTAPAVPPEQDGWECLQQRYKEYDGDATTGNCILEHSYSPVCGLITLPKAIKSHHYNTATFNINRGSHDLRPHQTAVTRIQDPNNPGSWIPSASTDTTQAVSRVQGGHGDHWRLTHPVQIIEKSQVYHRGVFKNPGPCVQESIHIGVQPTVALTTANLANDQTNSSFTDTQAYFEVEAECWVNTNYNTNFPGSTEAHCYEDEFWCQVDRTPNPYIPTYLGLYVQ